MSAMRPIPITVSAAADGLSNAVDLEDQKIAGIGMSATWTTAAISFLAAASLSGAYSSVYDEAGTEVTIASGGAQQGRTIVFTDALFRKLQGLRFLKLRSGVAATPVQQAAPRLITILASQ